VIDHLTDLDKFFKNEDLEHETRVVLRGDKMPWLFYNSDWQVKTELLYDDQGHAIDEDGVVITNPVTHDKPQANLRTWIPTEIFNPEDRDRFDTLKRMKVR
jgi:hypothetical protein